MTKAKEWLRVEMVADDPTRVDMFIFGLIGDWIEDLWDDMGLGFDSVQTAKKFQAAVDELPDGTKTINLRVNSPGGDVFGAITIANILRLWAQSEGRSVESSVEGLAASAASLVIQAGDPIRIADNGLIMIHEPWTGVRGNAREIRKVADELDTITKGSLVPTYQWHSSLNEEEIVALMAATTWLDADEAIAGGFATEKVEGLKAAASIDPKGLRTLVIPEKYRARVDAMTTRAPRAEYAKAAEVLKLCREGGCLDLAEELVVASASLEDVQKRVAAEKESRTQAKARATEINGLCEKAGLEELADRYISGSMPVDSIRQQLTSITARIDGVEIDAGLDPDHGQPDAAASWKKAFARASNRFGARRRDTK